MRLPPSIEILLILAMLMGLCLCAGYLAEVLPR
jgi:hypothetical protein